MCSLATAAVEFRRFPFNRKLGRFDQPARILHSNCLIFRHFSSHHHLYWPNLYFRFLHTCGHFHRTTAFLSKLIFFHTIIEWFKKCYAYSIAILNSIFLKQLLFIENSQWSSCWVLLRNFIFFSPPGVCEWNVFKNVFKNELFCKTKTHRFEISDHWQTGKFADRLWIYRLNEALINHECFVFSIWKIDSFFSSLKPRWTLKLGQLRWNNFSFKHLWTIFNPHTSIFSSSAAYIYLQ